MAELLDHRATCRAGYGEAVVLSNVVAVACRGRGAGAARPQRRGQDHAAQHHRRPHAPLGGTHRARRPRHHAAAARPARPCRRRLGAAGAQHLQLADGRGKPHRRRAARAVGRSRASTTCFRGSPSAAATSAINCPAASSRCWRSAARWCSIRACCCSTSRSKAWRRSSSRNCSRRCARSSATRACRPFSSSRTRARSRRHRPRDHPRARRRRACGDSAALIADPALLETYLGVTGAAGDARKARQDARRAATQGG